MAEIFDPFEPVLEGGSLSSPPPLRKISELWEFLRDIEEGVYSTVKEASADFGQMEVGLVKKDDKVEAGFSSVDAFEVEDLKTLASHVQDTIEMMTENT